MRSVTKIGTRAGPYAWYVCGVMLLTFALNYMDRTVISILVGPIERQFGMSDAVMGALQGAAFAVFYVLFGFPLARLADRGNRRDLLLVGALIWCGATGASGLAHDVPQLFMARIGVAIGESVVMPCAVSILADYFPPLQRAKAMSVYSMGIYLGAALALGGGGAILRVLGSSSIDLPGLGALRPWRAVFIAAGTLGLVLVPLLLTVREPVRRRDDGGEAEGAPSLRQTLAELRRKRRAILGTVVGFALIALAASTLQAWAPTLFVREHGWEMGNAGLRLGLMAVTLGPLGALAGGALADRLAVAGHADSKLIVGLLSALASVVASIALTLESAAAAEAGIASLYFLVGFNFGITQAALADLMPNRMRAFTSALYISMTNLFSATLGPLAVGVLNDTVFRGPSGIALSLRLVTPVAFLAAALVLGWGRPAVRQALPSGSGGPGGVVQRNELDPTSLQPHTGRGP
jgi:MFS family permease